MKKQIAILLVIGIILIVFAYNLPPTKTAKITGSSILDNAGNSTKVFTIEASNFKFNPDIIRVKKGDVVRLVVKNIEGMHSIHFHEDEGYDVEGTDVTFIADKAGTFEFHCAIYCGKGHDEMKGTLIVEE